MGKKTSIFFEVDDQIYDGYIAGWKRDHKLTKYIQTLLEAYASNKCRIQEYVETAIDLNYAEAEKIIDEQNKTATKDLEDIERLLNEARGINIENAATAEAARDTLDEGSRQVNNINEGSFEGIDENIEVEKPEKGIDKSTNDRLNKVESDVKETKDAVNKILEILSSGNNQVNYKPSVSKPEEKPAPLNTPLDLDEESISSKPLMVVDDDDDEETVDADSEKEEAEDILGSLIQGNKFSF